ncbi:coiled-coil domain-containing protein 187 [Bufo bufo]|uniref:coiled-coil domain-containing protein 187 n=1 Tax=Bufo bufo TaxID=8384 RepID=UPI001ABE0BC6|nr:coiled-coil domain-containing protein 187 [Bufo bufo]
MSSKEDWDGTALEPLSHVQDVSRAWDSLLEAKNVLQRIENKVDVQNQRRRRAQKARRRLQLENNSFSGLDSCPSTVDDSSHPERQEIYQRKPDETFTLHSEANFLSKMDIPWDLSSRTRPTPFLQEDKPSVDSFHRYNVGENVLAKSSQENFSYGQVMALRGSTEEYVDHVLEPSSLGLQTNIAEDEMEEVVNPYPAETFPPSGTYIRPSLSQENITSSPSTKVDLYVEKLEHLKSKSPKSKLEKLKEKIQEQKRRQDLSKRNSTKPHQKPEPHGKPPMKRKICKVTFGPPARCHKGFSTGDAESVPINSEEKAIKREKENLKTFPKNQGDVAFRCSRGKLKSKSPVTRKLSFQSPSPERNAKPSGLYGASAWREGQRLVQKILGPSPVTLLKHYSPKADNPKSMQTGSCRRCQKMGSPKQQPNSDKFVKGRIDSCQVRAEGHQSRPGCEMSGKDGEKPGNSNRSKSFSPKRPHAATNNMEKRPLGKENVGDNHEVQPNGDKRRNYSVEQIRDFMKKKAVERQKIERENHMKMKKALQTRKEQLDNVIKKQKEAFPPKRGGGSPTVPWKNVRRQPGPLDCDFDLKEVEKVRKNLSEWLHVTSNDLLREDDRSSNEKTKKQKTDIPSKDEHSSPLRLQDLAPVPTMSREIQVKDVISSRDLSDDGLPSHKASDFFSQCGSHQERLRAILTTAKDLGRRVELECNKLGSPTLDQHSHVSSPSPCSPPQMTSASGKYPIVDEPIDGQTEKHLHVNTGKTPEEKEFIFPTSVDSAVCWTKDGTKVSIGPSETYKHGRKKEYTEKTTPQAKRLHPQVHSEKPQKSGFICGSASTSPRRGSSPKLRRETSRSPPRRKTASPRKTAPPPHSEKKGKRGTPHHEGSSSSPGRRMEIAPRIQAQLQQQEKDLAALRLRAETEAAEAQRGLEEVMRRHRRQGPGLETGGHRHHSRGQESGNDGFGAGLGACVELDQRGAGNVSPVTSHGTTSAAPTETISLEHSWDHTEPATDSTSKWSEVGEFYGSPNMFTRFTLEMSQQYLREEELRARHQTALLRLREEALKEKTKAELALLNHQKIYWETKNEPSKLEELQRQEHETQRSLKQEQAEIRHLHNIYKAAHRERKLLLRQQREILRIQRSAVQIQQKLHNSWVTRQASEPIDLDASGQQPGYRTLHESTLASEHLTQDTQSAISDLSEDDDITEKTQTTKTCPYVVAQRTEDAGTCPVPEVCDQSPLIESDPQGGNSAEKKVDYTPDLIIPASSSPPESSASRKSSKEAAAIYFYDGAAAGSSSSGDGAQVTGSLQNNLSHPCPTREDLSQEDGAHDEIVSASKIEEQTFLNMQDREEPAGEPSDDLSLKHEDKKRETAEVQSLEELGQDSSITPETQEAEGSDHLATKSLDDDSSCSILAPSKSESISQAPDVGKLSPSLAEFQKVSAKLINISESSVSASDRGKAGEDTESGDSEVFDMESSEFPSGGPSYTELVKGDIMSDNDKMSSPAEPPDSRKPVILVMRETQSKTERAPLACESFPTSEDLTESDTKTYGINHLAENQEGSVGRITGIHKSTSMTPEEDGNAARMGSPDTKDQQRVTETNEKQSVTESAIFRKIEMMPLHATTSKDLFQIKSFPHRSEGDIIFITDEVLQPIEDTLSEILSPVDEKLSYESADLYSPPQDQSEELPSLPRDQGSVKSGDSDTEDFPTPPEEIAFSISESFQSSREASLIDEIHLLYDSLLTEDTLLPPDEIINTENSPLETENLRRSPEMVKPCRPFLTLSKPEDGVHDPLSTFEIGDQVLVKLSKPGTLMFKGLMSFKVGYWAGVALDKPEGDNDGTYEGIRYFECPTNCGVFVRPRQISLMLFDDMDGSDPQKDEDDDYSFGPSPGAGPPHDEGGGDTSRRQIRERDEEKQSSEKDTNQNQSRSCSLETSENISPRCLHTHPEEPVGENENPGQTLGMKQFCRGDTNKLIVPNPPQHDKHRLLLKVTDELISRVLGDAIETYFKISAPRKESVMNRSGDEEDRCIVAGEGFYNQLPSATMREAAGYVDTLVTDVINDCIKEYKKIRRKKGREHIHWSSRSLTSPFLVSGEDMTPALPLFTDGIFENLVKDSLQVIVNINVSRADQRPPPRVDAVPARWVKKLTRADIP